MTIELKHKESIFGNNSPLIPKVIRKVESEIEIEVDVDVVSTSTLTITQDFEDRLVKIKNTAISPSDLLNLEMQLQMVKYLEAIDWKLWEVYSKFVK